MAGDMRQEQQAEVPRRLDAVLGQAALDLQAGVTQVNGSLLNQGEFLGFVHQSEFVDEFIDIPIEHAVEVVR